MNGQPDSPEANSTSTPGRIISCLAKGAEQMYFADKHDLAFRARKFDLSVNLVTVAAHLLIHKMSENKWNCGREKPSSVLYAPLYLVLPECLLNV